MEPLQTTDINTATVSQPIADPTFGVDPFSPIIGFFTGGSPESFLGGAGEILSLIWNVFVFVSLFLSLIMLVLYIYASVRRWHYYNLSDQSLREAEVLYDAKVRGVNRTTRMDDIMKHIESDRPNDWKLAIIEADIVLDNLLKEHAYSGNTLGERLKNANSNQLRTLNDAWEAHKMRNMIAHEGLDFVLTKRLANETINRYRRVFTEFGIL